MNYFDEVPVDNKSRIEDIAKTLNTISYEIAELSRIKEELELQLSSLILHPDEGQKTYTFGKYDITMTTGYNYVLDVEEYNLMKNKLPACFNPVKEKVKFEIDKKIVREAKKYASKEELLLLSSMITEKPKKLHVRISAGV